MERVEKWRGRKQKLLNFTSEVELTVMLPFPAGLLSFITRGLVSFLEETIWAKRTKMNELHLNPSQQAFVMNTGGQPVPGYIPVLRESRRLADCSFHCRCRTIQTAASAPSQNSSQRQTLWRTGGSSSSWFSPSGQPENRRVSKSCLVSQDLMKKDQDRGWVILSLF